jgi:BirA family biotin operon repressor/biotin-[acetyl-CoA-carboxylase] ligase
MDMLHELAAAGAEAGTAVVAGEQLQGRGSRGRSWYSPPGGLWLSVLFRPTVPEGLEVISLRAGLAVAEAVQPLISEPLLLKWPNDLILRGRKLGGVLCEARWQGEALAWVAVGVGVNVHNRVLGELEANAVSLADLTDSIELSHLGDRIVAALRCLEIGAGHLSAAELKRFAARDSLLGCLIREPVRGKVRGLSADGALIVQPEHGAEISLRSGSVELVDSLTPR